MGVSAVSSGMTAVTGALSSAGDEQTALLKKVQDTDKANAAKLLEAIPPPPDPNSGAGSKLNVYA